MAWGWVAMIDLESILSGTVWVRGAAAVPVRRLRRNEEKCIRRCRFLCLLLFSVFLYNDRLNGV